MRRALIALGLATACRPTPAGDGGDASDEVLARIGPHPLTRTDVERGIAMEIYRRRVDLYTLMKRELDRLVEVRLLEDEARRRNISVDQLMQIEATHRPVKVTEAEVERYLAEHGQGPEKRGRVRAYLTGKARIERKLAFVEELRARAGVKILLEPPELPRIEIDTTGAPARGPEKAPVTLVHFASFSDPRSVKTARALGDLMRLHGDRVRWVHRHVVRAGDEIGLAAAMAAKLAHERGAFWPVHDALFASPRPLREEEVRRVAERYGISRVALDAAQQDAGRLSGLREELEIARRSGVMRPPVVFVNGRWFQGTLGRAHLETLVRDALEAPGSP